MGLLSTDIAKVRRLSLAVVKLPAPPQRAELSTMADSPPTEEEIGYTHLVERYPLIEELVDSLGLVALSTGDKIKKVKTEAVAIPSLELLAIARSAIEERNNYTTAKVKERIKEASSSSQEGADRLFSLILQAGYLEATPEGRYYLAGSTPF